MDARKDKTAVVDSDLIIKGVVGFREIDAAIMAGMNYDRRA